MEICGAEREQTKPSQGEEAPIKSHREPAKIRRIEKQELDTKGPANRSSKESHTPRVRKIGMC